jgi:hypothetical protein
MSIHQSPTDQIKKVELPSSIQQVLWTRPNAAVGTKVGIEVFTQFVGNNSEIKIKVSDKSGKIFETIKAKISGNKFWKQITRPEKAKDELYAEVKLPKHGLSKKSNCLYVYPAVQIKNCKWDKKEARRGDILKLTADVLNVYEGTEAEIQIWEYDDDLAHDFITKFTTTVKNKKIEAEWEYEYHEDTDDIPTKEETEKGYNPPEYFFRVIVAGVSADSGLLEFKDFIELYLVDDNGTPIKEEEYVIYLPDGSEKKGKLDNKGYAKLIDIPPGRIYIEYPNLYFMYAVEPNNDQEQD